MDMGGLVVGGRIVTVAHFWWRTWGLIYPGYAVTVIDCAVHEPIVGFPRLIPPFWFLMN